MAQEKDDKKKNVKVRDLAPKKDAKGGRASLDGASNNMSTNRGQDASSMNRVQADGGVKGTN